MDEQALHEWMDAVSAYLHDLAFNSDQPYDRPLPPVREDSTVLRDKRHVYNCPCLICRGMV